MHFARPSLTVGSSAINIELQICQSSAERRRALSLYQPQRVHSTFRQRNRQQGAVVV
jgi:hypothetical protein